MMVQVLLSLSPTKLFPSSLILPVTLINLPMLSDFILSCFMLSCFMLSWAKAVIAKQRQHRTMIPLTTFFISVSTILEFALTHCVRCNGMRKQLEGYNNNRAGERRVFL